MKMNLCSSDTNVAMISIFIELVAAGGNEPRSRVRMKNRSNLWSLRCFGHSLRIFDHLSGDFINRFPTTRILFGDCPDFLVGETMWSPIDNLLYWFWKGVIQFHRFHIKFIAIGHSRFLSFELEPLPGIEPGTTEYKTVMLAVDTTEA